jgi:hypothetical protein
MRQLGMFVLLVSAACLKHQDTASNGKTGSVTLACGQ